MNSPKIMIQNRYCFIACLILAMGGSFSYGQNENSLQSAVNQKARIKLIESLVNDLDDLIPGDYAADSVEIKRLNEIANAYLNRDQAGITRLLDELSTADPDAPPRELLLAGMSFVVNNSAQGTLLLERAGIANRNHPGIALAFGRLALLQNRFYDAYSLAEKASGSIAESGLSERAKNFYSVSAVALRTIIEIRRGEFESAEQLARQWEQLDSADDKMLLAAAEIQFKKKKLSNALEYLNRRSQTKQSDFPTELIVGKWYQAQGDVVEYSKWVTSAYEKFPQDSKVQIEYMAVLLRTEDFQQCLKLVGEFESKNGATYESKLIKGRVAFSQGDIESAGRIFSELFQQQPNSFENAYLNILAILEHPDPDVRKTALPLAQRVFQLFPNNQLATAVLGWALLKTGSEQAGGELLKRASTTGALLPDTAYYLATFMKMNGSNAQAIRLLEPMMNSKEVFLFRSKAQEFLESIGPGNELPQPTDK